MKNKNFVPVLIHFFAFFFAHQAFAQENIGSRCWNVFGVTPFSQQWRSAYDLLGSLNNIYERIPVDEELMMAGDAASSLRNIAMGTPSTQAEWHLWEEGLYDTIVEPKTHVILKNYRKPLISVFASDANQGIRELEMANLVEATSEQKTHLQNSLMWRMLTGKQPPKKHGYLFAQVSFSNTEFARHWKIISKKLEYYFPDFEITSPESLHMTVHFIGQWQLQNWQQYLDHATPRPTRSFRTIGHLGFIGKQNNMIAFRLYGFDSIWVNQIEIGNKMLNNKGLKQPEEFDSNYSPHITLAKLKKNSLMSSSEVNFRMRSLLNFLAQSIQSIPLYFDFKPDTKVELALAGAQRPKEASEYIGIEDFVSYYKTEPEPQD